MVLYTDQLGRPIELLQKPDRIISLVPSQTELLFDLGLDKEVIGITKFCVHPDLWHHTKTRVGGTKNLNLEKIRSLHPQLIIANKEENEREQVESLSQTFPVWISDVNTLDDACNMISSIGRMTDRIAAGQQIVSGILDAFSALKNVQNILSVGYLIWRDPYMTAGGDTFISEMIKKAGFRNHFDHLKRYPEIPVDELQNCDCVFLSSEPFPFMQKDMATLQNRLPCTKMILVDGEMFSWYGSRLLKSPAYFDQLRNQVLSLTHARGAE